MTVEPGCADSLLDQPFVRVPILAAYIGVFLLCLFGNMFTILVICAHRSMRTATNFFLANLALADLLVAIFCILQNMLQLVAADHGNWLLGDTLCKLYAFVLHLVPCTGIGILVCVSLEKYIAVLHPLLALKVLTPRLRSLMMAAIWAISLLCNMPYYTYSHQVKYHEWATCTREHKRDGVLNSRNLVTVSFVIWYCIPLCIIAFLYTRIGLVLWHRAPLKKMAKSAIRTISNETTTGGQQQGPKRSVLSNRPSCSAKSESAENGSAGGRKRTTGELTANGTGLPMIRVSARSARSATLSSESGGEASSPGEEEEEEEEEEPGTVEEDVEAEGARPRLPAQHWQNGHSNGGPAAVFVACQQPKWSSVSLAGASGTVLVGTMESRKKIIRLLIAIVCSFAVLTLPHHIRLVYAIWSNQHFCLGGFESLVQPLTYLLLFLSSSCNPFLYAFMSQRFRSAISDIFKCRRGRMRRKSTKTQNSDTLGCTMGAGETLSRCSSLTKLNIATVPPSPKLPAAASERNLLLVTRPGRHLRVHKNPLGKKGSRSGSAGSTSVSSNGHTQRPNGSLQMAVMYRRTK